MNFKYYLIYYLTISEVEADLGPTLRGPSQIASLPRLNLFITFLILEISGALLHIVATKFS
jgi:hypothetical protein